MRDAFVRELELLAATDPRIVLLSGDIGNRMFNSFRDRWPDRFYNCGVAEANMMSVAAGLGMSGLRPIVYTIVPFVTTRCLEQIRVDVCYHRAPVTIVGVGGGLAYASLGTTHHSCEDIAFLRQLPEMTVVCPSDPWEVRAALRAIQAADRPAYLRLGKKGEPALHREVPDWRLGTGISWRAGTDLALLGTGNILPEVLEAATLLESRGLRPAVFGLPSVKPLDDQLLEDCSRRFRLVVTIEEHSVLGGLGGAVAEWWVDRRITQATLLRIGTPDQFFHVVGDEAYLRRQCGLDAESLADRMEQAWKSLSPQESA